MRALLGILTFLIIGIGASASAGDAALGRILEKHERPTKVSRNCHDSDNGFMCAGGYMYKPDGTRDWLGSSQSCADAKVGERFACAGGYMYKPDNTRDWLGSSSTCDSAIIKGSYACAGGYLYKPDGTRDWLGSHDACKNALNRIGK